jgi:hypothetical protein
VAGDAEDEDQIHCVTPMLDLYFLECAITLTVVALQGIAFVATWRATRRLAALFPAEPSGLTLADDRLQLPPLVPPHTQALLDDTNRRLASSAATDDPMDVVTAAATRASSRLEQQAAATANAPVFLGLIGTFAGIIAGLVQMSMRTGITEDTVRLLLGGVLVAMVGSLCGVCLMVIATAIMLPRARRACDVNMDAWLLAAQELLPDEAEDRDAHDAPLAPTERQLSETALQALATFNRDFSAQVGRFHEAVGTLSKTVADQTAWMTALDDLDLARIVELNLEFLTTSQTFAARFDKLGASLDAFAVSMNGAAGLSKQIGQLLDRVTRFEESVNALGARIAADQSVTGQTIMLVRAQLDAIRARTDLVQEYVAIEDKRVAAVIEDHRSQIEQISGRAAQSIDRIGQEIAKEVARATEPARVQSLMEQVSTLPGLMGAAVRAAEDGVGELRRGREAHDASLEELRRMTATVTRAASRGVWPATRRAASKMFGWPREAQDVRAE